MSRRREHLSALALGISKAIKGADQATALQLAGHIAQEAESLAQMPRQPHLTRGAFHSDAIELAGACATLERLLASSAVLPILPMLGCVMNRAARVDEDGHATLRDLLARLRADLRAALSVTNGDATTLQLDLPERGDHPDDARRIASYVLGQLFRRGGRISGAAETSPAVECVRAVFGLLGIEAGARYHVQEWKKRRNKAPQAPT